jgi:hypothetical protein
MPEVPGLLQLAKELGLQVSRLTCAAGGAVGFSMLVCWSNQPAGM